MTQNLYICKVVCICSYTCQQVTQTIKPGCQELQIQNCTNPLMKKSQPFGLFVTFQTQNMRAY